MAVHLVAHRGECRGHVENTLASIQAALDGGINNIEIDVQLSRDSVPVLFHDRTLMRMYGKDSAMAETDVAELANKPMRLLHASTPQTPALLCLLSDVVTLLKQYPDARLFVEIKRVNFQYFSYRQVYHIVLAAVADIMAQVTLISFSYRFIRYCRKKGVASLGYVLPSWQQYTAKMRSRLQPDYIFCDLDIVPDDFTFGHNGTIWVLYEVASAKQASALYRRGVSWQETFHPLERRQQLQAIGVACR